MSNIVYAVHNFEAENEDEINFSVGEPIVVLEKDEKYLDGWWQGRNIKGETGLFPMNYTSPEKPQKQLYIPSPHLSSRSSGSTIEDEIDDTISRIQSSYPVNNKVEQWDVQQVADWLRSVGFESVSQNFIDQEITGDILLDLNIEALKELGINTFGKRYKIMQAITSLRDESGVEKLKQTNGHQSPPAPNASVSTSAIMRSTPSRASTSLRRSNSQNTSSSSTNDDGLYQFPRKAPLPPISHDIETNSFISTSIPRPLSPQSLSSSGISRSNTYNTVSSGGSRTTRSRELSPDPKGFANRTLSQMGQRALDETSHWLMSDTSSNIQPVTSKSTPKQSLQTANSYKLSFDESPYRASTTEAFQAPEHEGWLHKQSDKYKTWNKRWFVLKGTNLFYFKSPKEVRMKGIINLRGYKIIVDETIHAGKYCFKAQHEYERTFYFYTDTEEAMRTWLKMLMKTTIARDFRAPVMSSNHIATVSLDVARRMRPRPPSVIMYKNQKQTKANNNQDALKMPVVEEDGQPNASTTSEYHSRQMRESGITHHIIHEEEEEQDIPEIPSQYQKQQQQQQQQQQHYLHEEEEEDLIDPQHRSLPLSDSHHSITSSISEEEDDYEEEYRPHHWNAAQYIEWINSYLPPGKKVIDLTSAFRNGDTLILLLEAISQKTIRRPPAQKGGSVSVMMLDNIVAAFKFMGREGVEVDGRYTIKDVFGGNEDKILTMLDAIKEWADANYLKKSDTSVLISKDSGWRGSAMMDHRPHTALSDDDY